ncbi:nitrate reductase [Bosea sp. Root483D1]|uniref:periplasmic nitrate reductase, NapE protein n=1 Tax=Bosea sp. Root483D1 TaxID=1736544 RepID=UPI0007103225|nr:periplasmic nitrate reductase, NapE protein [Bosea sp. Root483D1]KRE14352.1 nitrate reductase [Bosea sp. Root483D1]
MGTDPAGTAEVHPVQPTRKAEIMAFLTLAVLIWPVVAVGIVGGYGFLIWMLQVVLGPPGPPR